jgi:hypothetical protein
MLWQTVSLCTRAHATVPVKSNVMAHGGESAGSVSAVELAANVCAVPPMAIPFATSFRTPDGTSMRQSELQYCRASLIVRGRFDSRRAPTRSHPRGIPGHIPTKSRSSFPIADPKIPCRTSAAAASPRLAPKASTTGTAMDMDRKRGKRLRPTWLDQTVARSDHGKKNRGWFEPGGG